MKWRIVGFNHPKEEKSIVYRQGLTDQQLMQTIKMGIIKRCNLFSIRGFETEPSEHYSVSECESVSVSE